MKIERVKLESIISIKGTKGIGTPDDPVRAVRLYFLPDGTFIGEVNGSGNNNSWNTLLNGLVESYKAPLQGHEPLQEFEKVCRPVVEFIQKRYGSPHHRVLIDWSSAVLLEDLKGVGFKEPD